MGQKSAGGNPGGIAKKGGDPATQPQQGTSGGKSGRGSKPGKSGNR